MWRGAARALCRVWLTAGRPCSSGRGDSASAPRGAPGCWRCGDQGPPAVGGLFCPSCRALQPPDPKRNFFCLLGCVQSFTVDVQSLKRQYQQLQRQVHPDNFSQKSQIERDFSEEHSTLVNEAYKTLLTPLSRGLYLLNLKGMDISEGTDKDMDLEFLGEIMEANEKLQAAQNEVETEEITAFVRAEEKELTEDLGKAFERGDLQEAKKLLKRMKYIVNLDEKIKLKRTAS